MAMLTDDILVGLFTETAATFGVPIDAAADIVARAASGTPTSSPSADDDDADDPAPPRRHRTALQRHRLVAIAACVIIAVGLAGAGLVVTHSTGLSGHSTSVASGPLTGGGTATPGSGSISHSASGSASPPRPSPDLVGAPSSAVPSTGPSSASDRRLSASAGVPAGSDAAREVIQTGSLDLVVPKGALSSTLASLTALATKAGGTVAKSDANAKTSDGSPTRASPSRYRKPIFPRSSKGPRRSVAM